MGDVLVDKSMHSRCHLGYFLSYSLLAIDRFKSMLRIKDNLAGGVELAALDCAELSYCGQQSVKVIAEERLVVGEKFNLVGQKETLVVA